MQYQNVHINSTPRYIRNTDTTELSFNKLIKFDIHHRQYILYYSLSILKRLSSIGQIQSLNMKGLAISFRFIDVKTVCAYKALLKTTITRNNDKNKQNAALKIS